MKMVSHCGRRLRFINAICNFEAGKGTESAKHRLGVILLDRIDQKAAESNHANMRKLGATLLDEFLALFQRKHRRLLGIHGHRNDHLIEEQPGADHQIQMAVGERIERSGIEYGFHRVSLLTEG